MRRHRRWWSQEEDNFLLQHGDTMHYREIAKVLGRSVGAIETRAWRLMEEGRGPIVAFDDAWSTYDGILNSFGVSRTWIRRRVAVRRIRRRYVRAGSLGGRRAEFLASDVRREYEIYTIVGRTVIGSRRKMPAGLRDVLGGFEQEAAS